MAANDLGVPLVRRGLFGRLTKIRLTPLRFAAIALVLAIGGVVLALKLNPDPLGGEPIAVLEIEPEGTRVPDGTISTADLGIRSALKPEDAVGISESPGSLAEAEEEDGQDQADRGLSPAPQKGLVEKGRHGLLPRIGPDGRRPSQAYSRPANLTAGINAQVPKIAILIGGMGLSKSGTTDAIRRLPPEISLAFAPYPKNLQSSVDKARQHGHEVMLQLPMEPFDYPSNDPGPYTLRTDLSTRENLQHLEWLLSRFAGYFGVTNYMGAKYTSVPDALRPTLKQISARGLMYVDDGASARSQIKRVAEDVGLSSTTAQIVIDAEPTPAAISSALSKLEAIAKERGSAIGVGSGLPITIDQIVEWSGSLDDKDVVIVPVSALMAAGQS